MKRTNGTDHTIIKKDSLEEKLTSIYGKPFREKKSDDRFKCIHAIHKHSDGDGYEYDDSTIDDDEIYED